MVDCTEASSEYYRAEKMASLRALALVLLVFSSVLLVSGANRHSFAWTEAGLLPAGILHWRTGSFEHFRVNPPLMRMLAALPVLAIDPEVSLPKPDADPRTRTEWGLARSLVEANGSRSLAMLAVARWTCIPISLLGAWLCYRWSVDVFGPRAGLLGLALWVFSPEMIAYGQMISGDAAAAVFGLLVFYVLRSWIAKPDWMTTVMLGVAIGLAVCAKTTWLILFGLVPLLWLTLRVVERTAWQRRWFAETARIGFSLCAALLVINMSYGFSESFQRLGEYNFLSRALTAAEPLDDHAPLVERNRFRGTLLESLPVPLPKDFVIGVDLQKWDFERPRLSYLDGQWSNRGWWYYYVYAMTMKMPLGNWVLILLVIAGLLAGAVRRVGWTEELLLLAPMLAILFLASSQTGLSKHSRYVLPMLPFLFIWVSRITTLDVPNGWRRILIGVPLVWSIASSLWIYPHSLSYFNESVGGPLRGYRHLNSSNIHWGEDLSYLKRWYDAHPEARPLYLTYTLGPVRPPELWPEASRADGHANALAEQSEHEAIWIAFDVAQLTAVPRMHDLESLPNEAQLVGMAGYGFRIYRIPGHSAQDIARQLAMPIRRF